MNINIDVEVEVEDLVKVDRMCMRGLEGKTSCQNNAYESTSVTYLLREEKGFLAFNGRRGMHGILSLNLT